LADNDLGLGGVPGPRPREARRTGDERDTPHPHTRPLVTPLKTGKGILRVGFVAALHPVAARRMLVGLRVVLRRADHLIGTARRHR
jgi:hypothetical protein